MKNVKFEDLIIQETDDLIAINKPPYVSTLEDRKERINILKLAKNYCSNSQVCHRLDKETSGLLLIAKHANAYRHISIQFEKRRVEKTYHAMVSGIHNFKDHEIEAPIATLSTGVVRIDNIEGKKAKTIVKTLQAHRKTTLVECKPLTGRMHQIRIHLALVKAPIIGDLQYGGKDFYLSWIKPNYNLKADTEEQPLIKRVALHAFGLKFEGLDGKRVYLEAAYPKDFKVLVKQIEKHS
ncbi:MAG: RNA pseudouridine synthase [Cyclobacteriaceae bacterium]